MARCVPARCKSMPDPPGDDVNGDDGDDGDDVDDGDGGDVGEEDDEDEDDWLHRCHLHVLLLKAGGGILQKLQNNAI